MLIYPYVETLNRVRKGQDIGISKIAALVLMMAGILVFIAVLYSMMTKGQGVMDVIDPLEYSN
ncbi:MAG: hypothetical protein KAI18_02515 [Candidatus Aenigmarchaeota archaeon]|nr:hypothetical protein [Candidatus Aenigmarchaeota archaeon]